MAEEIYICVVEEEGEEALELPMDDDKTLSLATLQGQFPGACGLKYRSPDTGAWRALRIANGTISQVNNDWTGNFLYCVVYPKDNKRKGEGSEEMETGGPKTKRQVKSKVVTTTDLIVMNLPWKLEVEQLKTYFETYGELLMVQLKKDLEGKSRGFGFIRFKTLEEQGRVLAERHWIDGRQCEVKLPQSKAAGFDDVVVPGVPQPHLSRRIFVGRVTEDITREDLETYFVKYGEITDVFVPKPHRMFAFVTFADAESARMLIQLGDDHLLKGCSVNVAYASPMKPNEKRKFNSPGWDESNMPAGLMQQMMASGVRPPKVPENPMEAMGMAMAMMKTWMQEPDPEYKKTQNRAGKPAGYQVQPAGNPNWKQGDGGYYGGGFPGGYGTGGVW